MLAWLLRGAPICMLLLGSVGCGARTTLREGSSGFSAGDDDGSDGDDDGGSDGSGGCRSTGGLPSADPPPILRYAFDGDARNLGSFGADYDGVVHSAWFDAGVDGQAVVTQRPAFVELPGTATVLVAADAFTLSFWFEEDGGAAIFTALLDCRSFADGFHVYRGAYDDSMTACWGAGDPSLGPGGCSPFPLAAGGWHHLLFQRFGATSDVQIWLDGAKKGTFGAIDRDVFGATTNDVFVGAPHVGELEGTGRIRFDELRVYNRVVEDDDRCAAFGGPWCDECPE